MAGPLIASTSSGARPISTIVWIVASIACTPMRLPTKFGVSLPTTMPLPSTSWPKRTTRSNAAGSVSGPATSSSSFMYRTGLKKCITRKFFRNASPRPAIISAIRRPDVFDATTAPGLTIFSSRSKSFCFGSSFSMIASITRSQSFVRSRSSSTLPTDTSFANEG
jgi:hypothetical protein